VTAALAVADAVKASRFAMLGASQGRPDRRGHRRAVPRPGERPGPVRHVRRRRRPGAGRGARLDRVAGRGVPGAGLEDDDWHLSWPSRPAADADMLARMQRAGASQDVAAAWLRVYYEADISGSTASLAATRPIPRGGAERPGRLSPCRWWAGSPGRRCARAPCRPPGDRPRSSVAPRSRGPSRGPGG
jgi:hypothetical protein